MGLFDHKVGKHRSLPSGFFVPRSHTLRDVQFLQQVSQKVLCAVASSENVMPRNSGVKSLQFRHPKSCLRYRAGGNFSQKLKVIGVDLFKHSNGTSRPREINAASSCVVLKVV